MMRVKLDVHTWDRVVLVIGDEIVRKGKQSASMRNFLRFRRRKVKFFGENHWLPETYPSRRCIPRSNVSNNDSRDEFHHESYSQALRVWTAYNRQAAASGQQQPRKDVRHLAVVFSGRMTIT